MTGEELLLGILKAFLEIPYIPQMLQALGGKLEAEWTGKEIQESLAEEVMSRRIFVLT